MASGLSGRSRWIVFLLFGIITVHLRMCRVRTGLWMYLIDTNEPIEYHVLGSPSL